jgi:hypothetical protein
MHSGNNSIALFFLYMTRVDSRLPTLLLVLLLLICIHNNLHASITDTSNTCDINREEISFRMTGQAHMESLVLLPLRLTS